MSQEKLFNDIPPAVVLLTVMIIGVEGVLALAANGIIGGQDGVGWRSEMIEQFAWLPVLVDEFFRLGGLPFEYWVRLVTYPFVHSGLIGAAFAAAMTLALGKFVGDQWSWWSIMIVFFGAAISAALVFGLIAPTNYPFFGAFPAIYGLIGAFTYMLWMRLDRLGANRWRAFSLIGFLLTIQLVFGLVAKLLALLGMTQDPNPITLYVGLSEIVGFLFGLAISPLVAPGGWSAFVARMRQR